VHEARKALKKARAALRLLRDGLDDAAYRAENAALRDAGRQLAPLRDSKAALAALDALGKRHPGKTRALGLEKLRSSLQAAPERALPKQPARLLRHCLERTEKPDFARIGAGPLDRGLRRIYRKGRKAFADARSTATTEALHEWRKQVKYLANALEALYGKKPGKLVKRAGKLAGRLGDEHDLAALSERTRTLKALHLLIQRRRTKLRRRAFALGKKLYERRPKRFLRILPGARA
jgi:CHAD domain-containing protein